MHNKMFKIIVAFMVMILAVSISLLSCKSNTDISQGETSTAIETETTKEIIDLNTIKEVTFYSESSYGGGEVIKGNVFGLGSKMVVLSHMDQTNQTSWFDFAKDLAQEGYRVITFDFRGYGKSPGDKGNLSKTMVADILAAISQIKVSIAADRKDVSNEKLFLIGADMGGTVSIKAAADYAYATGAINGLVSLSSPDKLGEDIDALSLVSKLTMPKIFICAEGDVLYAESANRLYENAVEPKTLEIIKNSKEHGTFIFEKEPENAQLLKDLIINFLNSN